MKTVKNLVQLSEKKLAAGGELGNSNRTISDLEGPSFIMNIPFGFSNASPNNAWIDDLLGTPDYIIDRDKAVSQWQDLYCYMAADSVVDLIPNDPQNPLQDLTFAANAGITLPHLNNVVVLSNFKSKPRVKELFVNWEFFTQRGYDVYVPPFEFEGEAELKWVKDNIYFGGYGQRTDPAVYDWFEKHFNMRVIRLNMKDEYLYHLDCSVFPVTQKEVIMCKKMFSRTEIAEVGKIVDILEVSKEDCYNGITNSVRLGNSILNASYIDELEVGEDDYYVELYKNRALEDIANELGMAVIYFNLSEFFKGGALLSCLVMHGNRVSFDFQTI